MEISASLKLRPIRLGFLINPLDRSEIQQAIQISTYLWGGVYNSLIPTFKKKPPKWHPLSGKHESAEDILNGYIRAFDPDYIVPIGRSSLRKWDHLARPVIHSSEILPTDRSDMNPSLGVGFFSLINDLYQEELRFVQKNERELSIPKLSTASPLIFSAFYGQFTDSIWSQLIKSTTGVIDVNSSPPDYSSFVNHLESGCFNSLDVTSWKTKRGFVNSMFNGVILFLIDGNSPSDIVQLWNLRALGRRVIPIPIQTMGNSKMVDYCRAIIDSNYKPLRGNPTLYSNAEFLCSPKIKHKLVLEFISSLKNGDTSPSGQPKLIDIVAYPRIWNDWARSQEGAENRPVESMNSSHNYTTSSEGDLRIETPESPFSVSIGMSRYAVCAITVECRSWGNESDPIAEVLPFGSGEIVRSFARSETDNWRIGHEGIVYLSPYFKDSINMRIPFSKNVLSRWFNAEEWAINESPPGKIASEMYRQLKREMGY